MKKSTQSETIKKNLNSTKIKKVLLQLLLKRNKDIRGYVFSGAGRVRRINVFFINLRNEMRF